MSPQSLSDAELERVREILDRFGDKRAMNLEQIDGFLAALVCGPEDIPESEYLPEIWGDAMVNEAAFARQPILQVFVSLITRYRDAIAHTLRTGAVYTPLLLQNEDGVACGNDWANGFVRGMGLRKQLWTPLLDDDENGGSVVPTFALARTDRYPDLSRLRFGSERHCLDRHFPAVPIALAHRDGDIGTRVDCCCRTTGVRRDHRHCERQVVRLTG